MTQVSKKEFERINSGIALDEVVEEVKYGNLVPLEKRITELEAQLAVVTAERDALKGGASAVVLEKAEEDEKAEVEAEAEAE